MTEVLVDTSALIAFFVGSEKHHLAVKNYFLSNPDSKWVILSTVFDETVTWLRVKISIRDSIAVGRLLRQEHVMSPYQKPMISPLGEHFVDMMTRLGVTQIVRF